MKKLTEKNGVFRLLSEGKKDKLIGDIINDVFAAANFLDSEKADENEIRIFFEDFDEDLLKAILKITNQHYSRSKKK